MIALAELGQTIDIMTLGGIELAVGILVDDAKVGIENITHHLENGQPLHEALCSQHAYPGRRGAEEPLARLHQAPSAVCGEWRWTPRANWRAARCAS